MTVDKSILISAIVDRLKAEYLGKIPPKYPKHKIVDVSCDIVEEDYQVRGMGGSFQDVSIAFKIESPKGKSQTWINGYLY